MWRYQPQVSVWKLRHQSVFTHCRILHFYFRFQLIGWAKATDFKLCAKYTNGIPLNCILNAWLKQTTSPGAELLIRQTGPFWWQSQLSRQRKLHDVSANASFCHISPQAAVTWSSWQFCSHSALWGFSSLMRTFRHYFFLCLKPL